MRLPRRCLPMLAFTAAAILCLRRPGQPPVPPPAATRTTAAPHAGNGGGVRPARPLPPPRTTGATPAHQDKPRSSEAEVKSPAGKPVAPRTSPSTVGPEAIAANRLANQAARELEIAETRKLESIQANKTPFCNVCEHEFLFVGVPVGAEHPATLSKLLAEIPGYSMEPQYGGQLQHWERMWSAINETNYQPAGLYAWKHLDIGLAEVSCMVQRWLVEPANPELAAPLHGTHGEVRGYYFRLKPGGAPLPFLLGAFPCAKVVLAASKAGLPAEIARVYAEHANSGRVTMFASPERGTATGTAAVQAMLDWLGVAGCNLLGDARDAAPMLECA